MLANGVELIAIGEGDEVRRKVSSGTALWEQRSIIRERAPSRSYRPLGLSSGCDHSIAFLTTL